MEPSDVGMHESTLPRPLDPIEKLILHLADSDGRCPKSDDRIQVIMFLVSEALPESFRDRLRFEPDWKWPHSQVVDDRLRNLREEGVIDVSSCSLTDAGKAISEPAALEEPLGWAVDSIRDLVLDVSEDELFLIICCDHPEYRHDSEEWARASADRRILAEAMLCRNVVSAARAAELAGVPEQQFFDDLYERGVRWRCC